MTEARTVGESVCKEGLTAFDAMKGNDDVPATEGGVGFTPGPWEIGERSESGTYVSIDRARAPKPWWGLARVVVRMSEDDFDDETGAANARLIAAAPELYDALRVALGWATGGMDGDWRECDHVELMRAALAKATPPPADRTAPETAEVHRHTERASVPPASPPTPTPAKTAGQ